MLYYNCRKAKGKRSGSRNVSEGTAGLPEGASEERDCCSVPGKPFGKPRDEAKPEDSRPFPHGRDFHSPDAEEPLETNGRPYGQIAGEFGLLTLMS